MSTDSVVSAAEIDRLLHYFPIRDSDEQLLRDYGQQELTLMKSAFARCPQQDAIKLCSIPGVGTRWPHFVEWLAFCNLTDLREILLAYAQHLGRIRSYRALALDSAGKQRIDESNAIWPSGRLRASEAEILQCIVDEGVRKLLVARLFIGLRLVRIDPSLSLHDDWETAVCIASTYMRSDKPIHLFELDVPVIETMGWRVCDVHDRTAAVTSKHVHTARWFEHNDIWFDADVQRTERYVLFDIPFLKERLRSLRLFHTQDEVAQALHPFRARQLELKQATESESKAAE
eukprot:TRINITY_DN15732_c0_g1_i1.p1 TRINITY_DN15732_c0_g1~~TRINITY_DN15732_c0_g1_i1.p1  ORF type:complete len:288 (-),score=57.16 TRINITY_DN15732_c0_g1_i1:177-1040(-)